MTSVLPNIFKAIALFTPGGDLIYGIDPDKQAQWHQDLCLGLQEKWSLADSPHFLVPGYTATIERWLDPQTQEIKVIAEANPPVERYIPLLQALFNLEPTTKWQIAPWQEEHCNRAVIETYKPHFPQLWQQKDLIIRLDPKHLSVQAFVDNDTEISNPVDNTIATSDKSTITSKGTPTERDTTIPEQVASHNCIATQRKSGYILRLFIGGENTSAEQTLGSIHQLLEEGLGSPYTLKVIDVNKNPQQAVIDGIVVTPTLVRVAPKPVRRIVGQLDDIDRVLRIITSFE